MTIKVNVQEAMKVAMKAQDKERLGVIRLILSDFKRIEVDERIELDEVRELAVLDKMIKQRRDSIEQFLLGGRPELAAKEQFEIEVIQSFMPAALTPQEVEVLIADAIRSAGAVSMQDMGKVMAILKPQLQGRADMSAVSVRLKALLVAG